MTQENFMRQIAAQNHVDLATVREVFECAEKYLFELFSSTEPTEPLVVKLLNGITLERGYVEEKNYSRGLFQNIVSEPHVKTKAKISKHYNKRVNEQLFHKNAMKGESS